MGGLILRLGYYTGFHFREGLAQYWECLLPLFLSIHVTHFGTVQFLPFPTNSSSLYFSFSELLVKSII